MRTELMMVAPLLAIFFATFFVWCVRWRWCWFVLLVLGYGFAFVFGQLSWQTALPLVLLVGAAWGVSQSNHVYLRYASHLLFIVVAFALIRRWWPGFHGWRVIGPERITPDAVPFAMYLGFDKPLIGFWLLFACSWIRRDSHFSTTFWASIIICLSTAVVCFSAGLAVDVVAWELKWPTFAWLWALNNLLLVCFVEEALFRGYIQGGLSRLLVHIEYGEWLALLVAAVLFGLLHAAGGWPWIVLAGMAGIGYGVAYRCGGLRAAILVHFGLNLLHFGLFTYPMLAPASLH